MPAPASEREESTITLNEAAKRQDAAASACPETTIDVISGQPAVAKQEDQTVNVPPENTAAAKPDATIDLKSGQPAKSADQEDRTVDCWRQANSSRCQ